ncbi:MULTISPECIES: heavy metal translocating P-type ATPase [unclassified Clostridium]|uniref:heavy metal translocating P-type ATPase n=1 Tax=Clostridium TaxID=1485 RepID=UPI001C8C9660|nr:MULTISPECIES: heavy metal translocating P-type ATPase [unclassified Clostridium]MBX9138917.1 cadmium-translocating P-type ATPase [Clostridium sp. K12(2020)]MBX9145709.1 cadmium-translocating P-type ATPase [Clostridium sp. K13]MDU2290891.1 heavy metal translocating P-type ATPase [Clostridium celatum]
MEIKLVLDGLNCANCANKIESKVNKINGVKEATVNFSTSILTVEAHEENLKEEIIKEIKSIVKKLEPHVNVEEKVEGKKMNINQDICKSSCCSTSHSSHNENSYSHEHGHSHEIKENNESVLGYIKDNLMLIIGAVIYIIALLYKGNENLLSVLLFVASYLVIGGEVIWIAIKNISRGEIFDENFLMSIATLGAFFIGEYPEAVAVMLFYQIGEMFQGYAVSKSRKSISSLMNIRADYANVLRNGEEAKVDPQNVSIDEVIIIKPGERIPLDGIVLDGTSFIDTSALTGESVPREITVGDEILSGAINNNGVLKVKVNKEFGESTVSRILELVENASNKKAPTEKFITKFSKVYTPIVVVIAILVAVIPPLVISGETFSVWIYRALSLLVVSCPCALVVSIPLGFFSGIGAASKKGILVKGGNYLEALKDSEIVVFDKTGTLTKGVFNVTEINPKNISKEELLEITAMGESHSNHPIAISIAKAYGKEINKEEIKDYKEISGHGIEVTINDNDVLLGNVKLMKVNNIEFDEIDSIGTIVYVAINGQYKGNIVISDEIKENVDIALRELKNVGIKKTVMLTGDNKRVAEKVAKSIGIDEVYSELLPGDKVSKVEEILDKNNQKGKVLFVGDGINDAPVLARADIGVAMGGIGSDAAIEAADVVLMKDKVEAIAEAIRVSRRTNKILWQNIIFSLGVKIIVMILVVLGLTNMWAAVFADVGVTLIAVLNSMRIIR